MAEPRFMQWGLVVLLLVGAGGCSSAGGGRAGANFVTGRISPAYFQFQQTVASDREPSGWWAVCIHATMRNGTTGEAGICKFEVGLPVRSSSEGLIDVDDARHVAAARANHAAYEVLSQAGAGEMLASLCLKFRARYQLLLREVYMKALVSACVSRQLTPVIFNIPPSILPTP
ncbi:hypothetical protein ACLESO_16945 [Pyxidicoccus sp. 3LG]